jgi:hypothetical protein
MIYLEPLIDCLTMSRWPNKSPEPTAVGAVSSAVAVHVASRRWLSFLRSAASTVPTTPTPRLLHLESRGHCRSGRIVATSSPAGAPIPRAPLFSPCHCRRTLHILVARPPTAATSSFARHTILYRRTLHSTLPIRCPQPNKSPEPMTVGRRSSASRLMLVGPSWLSLKCYTALISDM